MQVAPGDVLGESKQFVPGMGVYDAKGQLRASVFGETYVEEKTAAMKKSRMNVINPNATSIRGSVLLVGDTVMGRITRTNYNQAFIDVLCVGDLEVPAIKAVIRREDIRESEIDKVVVREFFRPNDIVRATVISLGDSKTYFLSTAKANMGVVLPKPKEEER